MKNLHISYLALGAGTVLALSTMAACSDDGPSGGGTGGMGGFGGGTGGMGGMGGSGGGGMTAGDPPCPEGVDCNCEGACCPDPTTATACYVEGTSGLVGDECLAMRDNSKSATTRVQLRQSWSRAIKPVGNTTDQVYSILSGNAELPLAQCNMAETAFATGFMQLIDQDLSDSNPANHTSTVGYAPHFTAADYTGRNLRDNGLCMVQGMYSGQFLDSTSTALTGADLGPTKAWPAGYIPPMSQPWDVKPTVSTRRTTNFNLETDREALLAEIAADPSTNGIFYLDDETGFSHGYSRLSWVFVAVGSNTNPETGALTAIAIPIREAEVVYQTNDPEERTCMGAYRAGAIGSTCASTAQTNPEWGCIDDDKCQPGEAPAMTSGYFLITELEQVYSQTLGNTLCITYPGIEAANAAGWPTPRCRDGATWDPSAADDAGLPMGDWCSVTNGPATATCHDAFQSVTFHTFSAHNISDTACALTGYPAN